MEEAASPRHQPPTHQSQTPDPQAHTVHGTGLAGGPWSPCGKAVQALWQVARWRREASGRRQGPVSLLQGALQLAGGLLVLDGPGEAVGAWMGVEGGHEKALSQAAGATTLETASQAAAPTVKW